MAQVWEQDMHLGVATTSRLP